MAIELTDEQRRALAAANGGPLKFIDPATQKEYVVVDAKEFQNALDVIEDERSRIAMVRKSVRTVEARMDEEP